MALNEIRCHELICDGCGDDFTGDHTPHFASAADAEEFIDDMDGRTVGGKHFCLDCVEDGKIEAAKEGTDG